MLVRAYIIVFVRLIVLLVLVGRAPVWSDNTQDAEAAKQEVFGKIVRFQLGSDDQQRASATAGGLPGAVLNADLPTDARDLVRFVA